MEKQNLQRTKIKTFNWKAPMAARQPRSPCVFSMSQAHCSQARSFSFIWSPTLGPFFEAMKNFGKLLQIHRHTSYHLYRLKKLHLKTVMSECWTIGREAWDRVVVATSSSQAWKNATMVVADMQKTNKNTCFSPARCASDIFYKASAYLLHTCCGLIELLGNGCKWASERLLCQDLSHIVSCHFILLYVSH